MELLSEINRFLRDTGMSPSRFGREALNDSRLVEDMRRGRDPRPRTLARIRDYLARVEA